MLIHLYVCINTDYTQPVDISMIYIYKVYIYTYKHVELVVYIYKTSGFTKRIKYSY